jgi:tetratricopeptide (TPR) repeat protein
MSCINSIQSSQQPRLFLSFSGRDRFFVARLMYSLERQGAIIWNYSRAGEEVPLGAELTSELKRRIDESDYFLPIITPNTLDGVRGAYARLETDYAIARGFCSRNRCLPISLVDSADTPIGEPYIQLRTRIWLKIRPDDDHDYEQAIKRICRSVALAYSPHFVRDPRIVFDRLFRAELSGSLSIADQEDLEELVASCERELGMPRPDWQWIADRLSEFLSRSERKHLGINWLYPRILLGLCQLETGPQSYENAIRTLESTTAVFPTVSMAWAALGIAHLVSERPKEAILALQRARELCPPDADWEIRFNLLTAAAMENSGFSDIEELLVGVNLDAVPIDDWVTIHNLLGVYYVNKGDMQKAVEVLTKVRSREVDGVSAGDATTSLYLHWALKAKKDLVSAAVILEEDGRKLKSANLLHHLARFYMECGLFKQAEIVFLELCAPPNRTRKYVIAYARFLKHLGRLEELKTTSSSIIGSDPLLATSQRDEEEFFYMGFAHYLLGNKDTANAFALLGRAYSDASYESIEP